MGIYEQPKSRDGSRILLDHFEDTAALVPYYLQRTLTFKILVLAFWIKFVLLFAYFGGAMTTDLILNDFKLPFTTFGDAFNLYPTWKPIFWRQQMGAINKVIKSNPKSSLSLLSKEELEFYGEDTYKESLEKLLLSEDNVYLIYEDAFMVSDLKELFDLSFDEANLVSTGSDYSDLSHTLPKNSPWTPIVSLGFLMLEERGIIQKLWSLIFTKDDSQFSPKADGISLSKVYLLFMFIATIYALTFLTLIFECIWSKSKKKA